MLGPYAFVLAFYLKGNRIFPFFHTKKENVLLGDSYCVFLFWAFLRTHLAESGYVALLCSRGIHWEWEFLSESVHSVCGDISSEANWSCNAEH